MSAQTYNLIGVSIATRRREADAAAGLIYDRSLRRAPVIVSSLWSHWPVWDRRCRGSCQATATTRTKTTAMARREGVSPARKLDPSSAPCSSGESMCDLCQDSSCSREHHHHHKCRAPSCVSRRNQRAVRRHLSRQLCIRFVRADCPGRAGLPIVLFLVGVQSALRSRLGRPCVLAAAILHKMAGSCDCLRVRWVPLRSVVVGEQKGDGSGSERREHAHRVIIHL